MVVWRLVCWCLQMIGSSELAKSNRVQRLVMLVVAACGSRCFNRGDGVVVALVECLFSVPDLSV